MHFQLAFRQHDTAVAVPPRFKSVLAAAEPSPLAAEGRSGHGLARLIAHDPRVVQRFDDHAAVVRRLLAADAADTLQLVAASNLLHGEALQCYRRAFEGWLDR